MFAHCLAVIHMNCIHRKYIPYQIILSSFYSHHFIIYSANTHTSSEKISAENVDNLRIGLWVIYLCFAIEKSDILLCLHLISIYIFILYRFD